MAEVALRKYVSSLPGSPAADSVYLVKTGSGFQLYATNSAGTPVAYPVIIPAADISDASANGRSILTATDYAAMRSLMGIDAQTAERDLYFADGFTGVFTKLLNAFADGFLNTAGIDAVNSTNVYTSDAGSVRPTIGSDVLITGGTPTVASGSTGSASNINDNNTGTVVTWAPGNGRVTVASMVMGTLNFGSPVDITQVTVKQHKLSLSTVGSSGIYYSNDGSTWTSYGATFGQSTTPTDTTRTVSVTAQYIAFAPQPTNYGTITVTFSDLLVYGPGVPTDMSLRLEDHAMSAVPSTMDLYAFVEEIDSLTLSGGTPDLVLYVSRNGGTTWTSGTATKLGTTVSGYSLIATTGVGVTGQSSGSAICGRIDSDNAKRLKVHAVLVRGHS